MDTKRKAIVMIAAIFFVLMSVVLAGATNKGLFSPKQLGTAAIVAVLALILALPRLLKNPED
jgi:hypothetical protein